MLSCSFMSHQIVYGLHENHMQDIKGLFIDNKKRWDCYVDCVYRDDCPYGFGIYMRCGGVNISISIKRSQVACFWMDWWRNLKATIIKTTSLSHTHTHLERKLTAIPIKNRLISFICQSNVRAREINLTVKFFIQIANKTWLCGIFFGSSFFFTILGVLNRNIGRSKTCKNIESINSRLSVFFLLNFWLGIWI